MGMMTSQYRKVAPARIEQRAAVRREVCLCPINVNRPHSAIIVAALDDLSKYGCRLSVDCAFKNGECLTLAFSGAHPVKAFVVWNKNGKLGCRFGAELDSALYRQLTLAAG
jgi:hypothetical protein